jgi:hypothetical protein
MLNQPLDLSIADASALEQDEAMASPDVQSAPSSWPSVHSAPADRDLPAAPNRRWNRWDEYVLIGAGAMIVAVLLVFSQLKGRQPHFAQIPIKLIAFDSDDLGESEHAVDHRDSAVTLLSKAMAEPIRRQVVSQLAALNKAYSRWIEGDPTTHGTVTLKLRVEPSGKVSKVEEVVSRLSEHRFLEVIIAEAKLWQLPHGGSSASEIVVPLVFNPRAMTPALQVAGLSKADAASTDVEIATAHTEFPLEVAEAAAPVAPMVAHNQAVLEPHTRGLLEPVIAEKQVAAEFRRNDAAKEQVAKRHETVEALALAESEIARAAALKHEPRFAADAIEKVSRGTRVTVLQKERDWFKVKVRSSGSIGYLRKEYLSPFHALR